MKIQSFLLTWLLGSACLAGGEAIEDHPPMMIYQSDESFEDVIENIKMAVEERGMLVSGTLHVSDMLNRTGPDLGYRQVFKKAESVEFCSAAISHKMTQVAAENMSICPFTISVFVKSDEPDQLYVSYRRQQLAGDASAITAEIYALLDGIVKESIE